MGDFFSNTMTLIKDLKNGDGTYTRAGDPVFFQKKEKTVYDDGYYYYYKNTRGNIFCFKDNKVAREYLYNGPFNKEEYELRTMGYRNG